MQISPRRNDPPATCTTCAKDEAKATLPTATAVPTGSRNHLLVFDEYLGSTATVYSSDAHSEWLGDQPRLALHAIVDRQNAAGGIQIQIQHSNDGIHWLPKYGGAGEISTPSNVPSSATASLAGFDQGATPSFRVVRLAVTLISPCTSAHVKIIVTGRGHVGAP